MAKNITLGTPIVWTDNLLTVGTDLMTLLGLLAGEVRVGSQHDLGVRHRVERYKWRMVVQFDVAPTAVGEIVEIYLATADIAADVDGGCGVIDAAGDVNMLRNMMQIGTLATTSLTLNHDMIASGTCRIPSRYVSPVIYNAASRSFENVVNLSRFILTPIIEEAGPV